MSRNTKTSIGENISTDSVVSVIRSLGDELNQRIKEEKPDYLVPLETKGAVILEMILDGVSDDNTASYKIIYPRAFDFLTKEEISQSKFMVIDDTFFTGRTLKNVKKELLNRGVKNYTMTALFNFSHIYDAMQIDGETYNETKFLGGQKAISKISHSDLLTYIQNEVLSERLPATYDHLIFESKIQGHIYADFFEDLSDSGRVLYYGRRGAFHTSTLLLDDIDDENLATIPKIRFWYHEKSKTLRMAPVVYPSCKYVEKSSKFLDDILNVFQAGGRKITPLDRMEAIAFVRRIDLIPYVKEYLKKHEINVRFLDEHLHRYYPGSIGNELVKVLNRQLEEQGFTNLPSKKNTEHFVNYLSLVPEITGLLRNEYEKQGDEGKPRSEFTSKGFTISELLLKFSHLFSSKEIHSAIDYCYDNLLVASFNRKDSNSNVERALRTTEINQQKYLAAEVFGSAILYSGDKKRYPVWIPNKVYSILQKGLNIKLETLIAVTHYYGDRTSIAVNENTERMWSTLPSSLWKTHRFQDSFNEQHVELECIDTKETEAKKLISSDPRLIPYQSKIDAIHHLCEQGGYEATVLANILCDSYGGTTYLAFNLENLLEDSIEAILEDNGDALKSFKQHRDGVETKLRALFSSNEHIDKMKRRITQLRYLTKINAEEFVDKLIPLPNPNGIYASFQKLFQEIQKIQTLISQKNYQASYDQYKIFQIEVESDDDLIKLARIGNQGLLHWIYALSGKPQKKYEQYIIGLKEERDMWVIAYDLRGGRREIPKKYNISLEEVNKRLHGFIANWIIANRGLLSPANENLGDRRYGYFNTEIDAVNAALWIDYHSRLLSKVNPAFAVNSGIAGIGIGHGRVRPDNHGGEEGETLDVLGHQIKGYVDKIADEVGAKNGQAPIWIVKPTDFQSTIQKGIHGTTMSLDGVPITALINQLNETSCPWYF